MSTIKTRMKRIVGLNETDIIYQETSSDLVLRSNGQSVETAISNLENTINDIDDALEILLSGEGSE